MNNILTPQDVCQRYTISRWTLYQWVSKGFIPYVKIRGLLRFFEKDLEKWEQSKSAELKPRTKLL